MSNILVTGSGAGLGAKIASCLREDGHNVFDYDIKYNQDVLDPAIAGLGDLDVLINNAARNEINWLEDLTEEQWDQTMGVNTKGVFKMVKACLPLLIKSRGTILNIVSNAAHKPMRCSLAYNASKGALHIMTLQLARELTERYGITVFGVAPNKLHGTEMSAEIDRQVVKTRGWSEEASMAYQLNGLMCHEETPIDCVASFIAYLLINKRHHKYLTGCILPYGA